MTLPSKQQAIMDYCRTNGSITTQQAYSLLKDFYYYNHEKYISEILTKMVKMGKLVRVAVGVYEIGGRKEDIIVTNQNSLF